MVGILPVTLLKKKHLLFNTLISSYYRLSNRWLIYKSCNLLISQYNWSCFPSSYCCFWTDCFIVLTNTFLRNSFLAAGFSKVADCFGFLLWWIQSFQEQFKRNKISKYQKILASIAGPAWSKIVIHS